MNAVHRMTIEADNGDGSRAGSWPHAASAAARWSLPGGGCGPLGGDVRPERVEQFVTSAGVPPTGQQRGVQEQAQPGRPATATYGVTARSDLPAGGSPGGNTAQRFGYYPWFIGSVMR